MISAALLDDHPAISAGVQATIEPLRDIGRKASPTAALIQAIRHAASPVRLGLWITPKMKAGTASTLDPRDHAIFAMRLAGDWFPR